MPPESSLCSGVSLAIVWALGGFSGASKGLDEIYNSTVSKRDLKHFSKSDILGFASGVFMDIFPPGGRLNHDDYNLEQFTNI